MTQQMAVLALKLDADNNIVGHTIVPDLATLRLQTWPQDRYVIVPEDHEVYIEWEVVETSPTNVIATQRPRYRVRPRQHDNDRSYSALRI